MVNILELDFSTLCDIGQQRENNEDYTAVFVPGKKEIDKQQRSGSLFIVADGVGGAARGELASKYAAETVIYEYYRNQELPPEERLKKAYQKANREIYNYAEQNFSRMATTMVAAVVLQNQLIVANVGDSRAYLIRGGEIQQISQDHTIGAELKRNGSLREGEAATEKAENTLTRSIGGEAGVIVDIFKRIPLQLGDKILLCSDGLNKGASDAELPKLSENGTPEKITDRMFRHALRKGSKDNIALILMETVEKSGMKQKKKDLFRRVNVPSLGGKQAAETDRPKVVTKSKRWKQYIPVLIGFGVIAMLASLIWTFVSNAGFRREFKDVFYKRKIAELNASETEDGLPPTEKVNGAAAEEPTPTLENKMRLVPTPTKSFNEDPSTDKWKCLYQFTELHKDFYVANALEKKFGEQFNRDIKYEGYKSCDITANNEVENCNNPVEYSSPEWYVENNWWIVVSSSPSENWLPEDCVNKGGYIQRLGPLAEAENEAGEPLINISEHCVGKGRHNNINVYRETDEKTLPYPRTIAKDEEVDLLGHDDSYAWLYIQKPDTDLAGWVVRENIQIVDITCVIPVK